jgi:signal transduction histidine kinase
MDQIEQLKQQLHKQEKLASLGLLSAGIAHEIQNPLNFVINFSKISGKLLSDLMGIVEDNEDKLPQDDREDIDDIVADLKENLSRIVEHSERAVSIIQGILLVSRGKENEFLPTDICKLVKEYVWLSYHAMRANIKNFNINIHEQYEADMPMMMVIPQDLSRAILNMVNNACYALWSKKQKAGEDYNPELSVSVKTEGSNLVISIADNGEGMTEEVKQRLYENFFTTKPVGQGTGLGMGITRDIIENKHGGRISFESTEGEGTTFTFTIPIRK